MARLLLISCDGCAKTWRGPASAEPPPNWETVVWRGKTFDIDGPTCLGRIGMRAGRADQVAQDSAQTAQEPRRDPTRCIECDARVEARQRCRMHYQLYRRALIASGQWKPEPKRSVAGKQGMAARGLGVGSRSPAP